MEFGKVIFFSFYKQIHLVQKLCPTWLNLVWDYVNNLFAESGQIVLPSIQYIPKLFCQIYQMFS